MQVMRAAYDGGTRHHANAANVNTTDSLTAMNELALPVARPLFIGPENVQAALGQDWRSVLAFAASTDVPVIDLCAGTQDNGKSLIPVAPLVDAIERIRCRRDAAASARSDRRRGETSAGGSGRDFGGTPPTEKRDGLSGMPNTMTAAEVASVLRLSVVHVRRLCRQGLIRATRRVPRGSSRLRFEESEVARYLREIDGS